MSWALGEKTQHPPNEFMDNYMLVEVLSGLSIQAKLNQTKHKTWRAAHNPNKNHSNRQQLHKTTILKWKQNNKRSSKSAHTHTHRHAYKPIGVQLYFKRLVEKKNCVQCFKFKLNFKLKTFKWRQCFKAIKEHIIGHPVTSFGGIGSREGGW